MKRVLQLNFKTEKQKISVDPQPLNKIEFSCISTAISSQKQVACPELKAHPIMKQELKVVAPLVEESKGGEIVGYDDYKISA